MVMMMIEFNVRYIVPFLLDDLGNFFVVVYKSLLSCFGWMREKSRLAVKYL
jgi:hypothetical protein